MHQKDSTYPHTNSNYKLNSDLPSLIEIKVEEGLKQWRKRWNQF